MRFISLFFLLPILAVLVFAAASPIYAQEPPPTLKLKLYNPLGDIDSFAELAAAFLKAVVVVAIPLTVLFLIWGGFLFVTAQGNEQQVEKAKKAFFWAVIGAMVVIAAWAMAVAINTSVQDL